MTRTILPLLTLLLAACTSDALTRPSNGDPEVTTIAHVDMTTDKQVYARNEPILVSIRNDSERNMIVWHCNWRVGMAVEQWTGVQWTEKWAIHGPRCLAIYAAGPIVIAPRSSASETAGIERPGHYRLKIQAETELAHGKTLISLVSNVFSVVE